MGPHSRLEAAIRHRTHIKNITGLEQIEVKCHVSENNIFGAHRHLHYLATVSLSVPSASHTHF